MIIIPSNVSKTSVASVLRLPFNTNINDVSSNALTFTSYGGSSISGYAKYGAAGLYTSGSSYIRTGAARSQFAWGTSDFTIELWIQSLSSGSGQCIFDFRPVNTVPVAPALFIGSASGSSRYLEYYLNSQTVIISTTGISYGTWYHVAICRSSGVTKMFLNGTQTGSNYTDTNSYEAADPCFGILGYNPSLGYGYTGAIDDVRITTTALYTANFTPPSEELPVS